MRESTRLKNKKIAIDVLIVGIILLILSIFLIILIKSFNFSDTVNLVFLSLILPLILIISSIIGIAVNSKKPFIICFEVGIDAFRKKYLEANDSNWFFSNLSSEQILSIKKRIDELELLKHEGLSNCKNDKEKINFKEKYDRYIQKAFYCYIYRSGTRYTQNNYKKTPYIGTTEYWGEFYSPSKLKNELEKKRGI